MNDIPRPDHAVLSHVDAFVAAIARSSQHLTTSRSDKLAQIDWLRNARDEEFAAHDAARLRLETFYTNWLELLETELRNIDAHAAALGVSVVEKPQEPTVSLETHIPESP